MLVSCQREVALTANTQELNTPAVGGEYAVTVSANGSWIASSDDPWISISPANGQGSTQCQVRIDSSLVTESRLGIVRFRETGSTRTFDVRVSQDGFDNILELDKTSISLSDYASLEDREFSVKVRTNVPFTVDIPAADSKWLSCELPKQVFDRGARPREFDVKFKWNINSRPSDRVSNVTFASLDGVALTRCDELEVRQKQALPVEIGRQGDSVAVAALFRNLGVWNQPMMSNKLDLWDGVTIWEEGDEGYTPAKKGRVRSARFFLFDTQEAIPYEVRYLTEAEELSFYSNVNFFVKELNPGDDICELTNLKKLTISAYGLTTIPESFKKLKNLEYLDISSNCFDELPAVLTPQNFPNLRHLYLNTCQKTYILDLGNSVKTNLGGFHGKFPKSLLEWEALETLRLSVNYIEGEIPDMLDYPVKYTEQDVKEMNLPSELVGTPKVLPNATFFAINLNRLYGNIPDWILYHPNLVEWNPYTLVYNQEGKASNGKIAAFDNVPVSMDYYWKFYEGYKEHQDIYMGD